MNCKRRCKVCGFFKEVGFTDIGMVCETCYTHETHSRAFNLGIDKVVAYLEECTPSSISIDEILQLKEKLHGVEK